MSINCLFFSFSFASGLPRTCFPPNTCASFWILYVGYAVIIQFFLWYIIQVMEYSRLFLEAFSLRGPLPYGISRASEHPCCFPGSIELAMAKDVLLLCLVIFRFPTFTDSPCLETLSATVSRHSCTGISKSNCLWWQAVIAFDKFPFMGMKHVCGSWNKANISILKICRKSPDLMCWSW